MKTFRETSFYSFSELSEWNLLVQRRKGFGKIPGANDVIQYFYFDHYQEKIDFFESLVQILEINSRNSIQQRFHGSS